MCGICGFFGADREISKDILCKMNQPIHHRGPDEEGYFFKPGVGLAMKRLSIIDLKTGSQPLYNEDKSICLVFNGEIYNYKDLKSDLQKKGHTFTTNSDTETIVHLYEEYGFDFATKLRGMFAIAIWDDAKKIGILARDRLGIKPLFYSLNNKAIFFGSEIKCILQNQFINRDKIDWQALDMYMTYTYVPAPFTIYKQIKKLEPATMIIFQNNSIKKERYWDLSFNNKKVRSLDEWIEMMEREIQEAVETHLVSDVPVGAFLSGGIDSSLVVSMMSQYTNHAISTFTMGFSGESSAVLDERPFARLLGQRYTLDHNEFSVEPDFHEIISDIVKSFDEPFADDSVIPSYYVSKITSESVKVALSGLGGDELFGGYERYSGFLLSSKISKLTNRFIVNNFINPIVSRIPEPSSGKNRINHLKRFTKYLGLPPDERYQNYVSTISEDERKKLYSKKILKEIDFSLTKNVITGPFNECDSDDLMDRVYYTDLKTYLPDDILTLSDRISMLHSLELRVPLVDHKLVELTCQLPNHFKINKMTKKYLLKKIAKKWLPKEIIYHRKQGFESPMASWLKKDLKNYIFSELKDKEFQKLEIFDNKFILSEFNDHLLGKKLNNKLIFSVLMFKKWFEKYQ